MRPARFDVLAELTALTGLSLDFSNDIVGLSMLSSLVCLERWCLGFVFMGEQLPWEKSGGKDFQQALGASSQLTHLELRRFMSFDDEEKYFEHCILHLVVAVAGVQSLREVHLDRLSHYGLEWQDSFARVLADAEHHTVDIPAMGIPWSCRDVCSELHLLQA